MGKEQDLLQASKAGNVAQIEKLLGHKSRKSSIQSFISRTVNPNHQDEMGYTALHYAALNGHRSSVELLLKYDASTNIPDNSGNYPLHLAAWNGHAEVARILINTGPSRANVNEQNGTEDTALHSASQFGHNQVVAILLENHADPSIRNSRNESALDLAAQYGRMETVKLLLSYHPNLLEDLIKTHTPFHLAARNGHMNVVSYLLSCGMSVNTQCNSGTALHEAALYGKVDVVNLLLQCGIDVNVKDEQQQTVMDLLVSHPSARTREIGNLIYERSRMSVASYEHLQGVHAARKSRSSSSLSSATLPYRPASAVIKRPAYDDLPDPVAFVTAGLRRSGTYDSVPLPRSRNESLRSQLSYDLVPAPRQEATESTRGSMYSEVKPLEGSLPRLTPAGDGYALLGPADMQAALTPQDIHSGYTVLGAPAEPRAAPRKPRPPQQLHAPAGTSDPYGDYSKLRLPVSGPTDPVPMVASLPNQAYSIVSPRQQDRTQASSPRDDYDMVAPVPKPRRSSRPKQSVYEVPPSAATGPEGVYGFVGAPAEQAPRPPNGKGSSVESLESSSSYDLVTVPAKRAPRPAYDLVPPRPPDQSFGSDIYEPVSTLQPQEQAAHTTCPLDGPEYELVQPRTLSRLQEAGDETLPFAPIPGYEPMGPSNQKEFEYELLAPVQGSYETIEFVGPQSAPSSASSPPVYEIAPLPRSLPRPPPDGSRSQPPDIAPPPPPRNVSGVVEMPWFEKPRSTSAAPSPRRVMNEYQECPLLRRPDVERGGAYEEVRVEGPPQGVDWTAARQAPTVSSGGEYCVLSDTAKGPDASAQDWSSTTSSGTTSLSEPFTPPFSPPSPATAQTAVFDAFSSVRRAHQTIPEVPERGPRGPPAISPRKDSLQDEHFALSVVELLPFPASILESPDSAQDPFSHPPVAGTGSGPVSPAIPRQSAFASLHQRYSPFSSNEDLTADANGRGTAQQDRRQDRADRQERANVENGRSGPQASPLVYENVLFTRTDSIGSTTRPSAQAEPGVTRREATDTKTRPESYRLSAVPVNSPLDETAEWEKIEAFLSSIGDIEIPDTLEDQIANAGKAATVPEWLRALGLGQYESTMMANGFDELLHLNGVLEEQDLLEIGVEDPSHRRITLEAAKALPPPPYVTDPDGFKPESMEDWLERINLPEYTGVFRHQGYSAMARVRMLWEVELTSVLEINTLGHRRRMLASLKGSTRSSAPIRPQQEESLYVDTKIYRMQEKLHELNVAPPKPHSTAAGKLGGTEGSDALLAATRQLAVQEKLAASRSRWRHEPSVLIDGSVEYTMLYLGSHAVQEITGLASTVDACRKMRLSTAKLQKFPSVILSVSVKGIKFIDARSKILVSYHDMATISYITQDPEDRHVFAYIARDTKNERHYCHVFKVKDVDLSTEVTMTIGQAFELAYAHFMEVQSLRHPDPQDTAA